MKRRTALLFRKIWAMFIFGAVRGHGRKRRRLAASWLFGSGIEIGALNSPLAVPAAVRVTYVDRMSSRNLLVQYPELSGKMVVPVDIIDNGETLSSIPDDSQEFIIANHFLEHCENPVGALQAWLRVLKSGGVAYIAVPDKRFTFDFRRETTDVAHVVRDYSIGPEHSRRQHYMEWVKLVMTVGDGEAVAACDHIDTMRYSIHFHAWSAKSLKHFFIYCREVLALPFSMCEFVRNGMEIIVILTKTE